MKTTKLGARLLALILTLCTLIGLLPAVTVFEVKAEERALTAEEANEQETLQLLGELMTAYEDFKIPQTKAKWVTNETVNDLEGTYFMFIMDRMAATE